MGPTSERRRRQRSVPSVRRVWATRGQTWSDAVEFEADVVDYPSVVGLVDAEVHPSHPVGTDVVVHLDMGKPRVGVAVELERGDPPAAHRLVVVRIVESILLYRPITYCECGVSGAPGWGGQLVRVRLRRVGR